MTTNDTPYYIPVGDILLIRVDEPTRETASGIIIKEDWKTLPPTGTVISIGSRVTNATVGDQVVFERYSSVVLDDDLRLCKDSNILAIRRA
jgi:co-chaperonin GroES (HSP10)